MKKIIVILIVLAMGWYGNQRFNIQQQEQQVVVPTTEDVAGSPEPDDLVTNSQFKCDGRTHCSQMTSCEEATFFLNNCPDTKMDGNNDGVPCEKQWCC